MTSTPIEAPQYLYASLVKPIERAVKGDRVTGLASVLRTLDSNEAFAHPELFAPAREDRYARKLIWQDPRDKFVIVGLTWGANQSSPLHDHAGLWGAEIVVRGAMRETAFRLVEEDAARGLRFAPETERTIERGGVGILIPPLEYHDFGNAGLDVAHTLHVYGGNLRTCRSFSRSSDEWWTSKHVSLAYDA